MVPVVWLFTTWVIVVGLAYHQKYKHDHISVGRVRSCYCCQDTSLWCFCKFPTSLTLAWSDYQPVLLIVKLGITLWVSEHSRLGRAEARYIIYNIMRAWLCWAVLLNILWVSHTEKLTWHESCMSLNVSTAQIMHPFSKCFLPYSRSGRSIQVEIRIFNWF